MSGSSPTTHDESYIRTTLPGEEITLRSRTGSAPSIHRQENTKSEDHSEALIDKISLRQDLRQNKMYSSLTRPSTARARQTRDRRGSFDEFSKGDDRPGSPRDTASVFGNLGMENNLVKGGERRQYRQAVNPEVQGAIDHFIRSEQRLVVQYILSVVKQSDSHFTCLCLNCIAVLKLRSFPHKPVSADVYIRI